MNQTTLKYYEKEGENIAERYESADVSDLHRVLTACFKLPAHLLELGCGSGRDAAFMTQQGFTVTAIDGSAMMIESALTYHPELSGHLHTIALPDELSGISGKFDGIFSIATLMHFSQPQIETILARVNSLLVSKGRFFFCVPIQRADIQNDGFDANGRWFTAMTKGHWFGLCKKHGVDPIWSGTTKDGLGRKKIAWLNCLTEKSK
jgi:cyclopropane fatty-acyl-phospholipid synthase-like methyltransferase